MGKTILKGKKRPKFDVELKTENKKAHMVEQAENETYKVKWRVILL